MRAIASRFSIALLVLGSAACGNAALHAAEQGDLARLKNEIAEKHSKGQLSNDEAAHLAQATAEREIANAKTEGDASRRLAETRGCAREIDDALESRMQTHDGPGAEAALELVDDGLLSESRARDFLDDQDDRWRAVGARTLHRDGDGPRRRKTILDPSPRVRRSAIRAAADAKEAADLDTLFETARVDPEPLLRNEALRSMREIVRAEPTTAQSFANRLRDLWTSGDDAMREEVAVSWVLSPTFSAGGREALRTRLASEHGPGVLAAASAVARNARDDKELQAEASALVARTIGEGSQRDRLHAIVVAKPEGLELAALEKASLEDNLDVKLASLGKLLASSSRERAKKTLTSLASYGVRAAPQNPPGPEDDRYREAAARARQTLASSGDLRVQAWIEEDLSSPRPDRRLGAVQALSSLGRSARGAPLLADPDPSVRTRAACTILVASRSR